MEKRIAKKKIAEGDIFKRTNVIIAEIRSFIETTRGKVAVFANAQLTILYWRIGERVYREILHKARAEYGSEILSTLSAELILYMVRDLVNEILREWLNLLNILLSCRHVKFWKKNYTKRLKMHDCVLNISVGRNKM